MEKDTIIDVVPIGGLCNRINTIICSIATHNRLGCNFNVDWRNCSELKADFEDLFEPIDIPGINILPLHSPLLWPGGNGWGGVIMSELRMMAGYDLCLKGTEHSNEDFRQLIGLAKKVYITASNRFTPYTDVEISSFLHPVKRIRERIMAISHDFDNVIGIHIRRTDNVASIATSTDEKFFVRMDEELRKDPQVRFFLATDSTTVKDEYRRRYGDAIVTNDFDLSRNTLQGMKNAVVDLWCLARCARILGSASSTYSTCAANIYNKKIEIII